MLHQVTDGSQSYRAISGTGPVIGSENDDWDCLSNNGVNRQMGFVAARLRHPKIEQDNINTWLNESANGIEKIVFPLNVKMAVAPLADMSTNQSRGFRIVFHKEYLNRRPKLETRSFAQIGRGHLAGEGVHAN